jgi:hypothetical protein
MSPKLYSGNSHTRVGHVLATEGQVEHSEVVTVMDLGRITGNDQVEEKERVRKEFVKAHPPRLRFASDIRESSPSDEGTLDHFEFMMALMEAHPIIPFEDWSFASDLLDARRALAYHVVMRQLGHARSVVENANTRNRVGIGVSLRCMLEIYAGARFFCKHDSSVRRIGLG